MAAKKFVPLKLGSIWAKQQTAADLARFPEENPNPVMRIAADGTLLYTNSATVRLLEILGWRVGEKPPAALRESMASAAAVARSEFDLEVGDRVYSVASSRGTASDDVNLYFRDVTDRRQAEEALRRFNAELERHVTEQTSEVHRFYEAAKAERQRLYDVLETLPVYVVLLSEDYHMLFANRFFRERFGESDGRRCFESLFDRAEPCENCETYTVLKTGAPHHWDWHGPDGRDYEVHDFPFTDSDGSQLIMEMGMDVTEQKRLGEELRSASSYSRSLIEASLDPLVTISPEGKITDVNRATELVTGVSREHLVGSSFSNYFTDSRQGRRRIQEGHLPKASSRDYPLTIRHTRAGPPTFSTMPRVYTQRGRRSPGRFRRRSRHHRTQEARKRPCERHRCMHAVCIEASLDPLVTISPEGKITDVNQATELATGVARNDLIGSVFSSYFTEPQKADEGYRKVISEGFVRDYPLTIRHVSGSTMDVLYNATVYRNEAGEVQGVFAAARDITERKRAEEELNHYREHLEELVAQRTEELARSNKDLEQFAYVASHDLQEPLRMVAGYLQLLSERYRGQLDEKADKFIDYAVDGAERMSTLIRDLLDYSRVNTQGEELRNVDSKKAFESALRNLGSAIEESGAAVTHDPLPVVRADKTQLAQLFQNLIGNAIKFRSPERPPRDPCLGPTKSRGSGSSACGTTASGFEQQYEDKIFLIFQRLHGRGQYPGTGIGLAICKRIVERHGGRIWAASEPDQGHDVSSSPFHSRGNVMNQQSKRLATDRDPSGRRQSGGRRPDQGSLAGRQGPQPSPRRG